MYVLAGMLLILVTGMPGSGKSVVSSVAREKGLKVYVMGDVVREEARRRGLPLEDKFLGKIALELREKEGMDAVAKRLFRKIISENDEKSVVVVEGLRSLEEYDYFRRVTDTHLIAVHASPETRFKRLKARGRDDDPHSREEFDARDRRELKMGLGSVIALSQTVLINEDIGLHCFRETASRVLDAIIEGWMRSAG